MTLDLLKLAIKHLLGRDLLISPKSSPDLEFFGTRYGGWSVPVGLVHKDSVVYSFGVGEDASWDLGLINSKGCVVHAFDPTPKSLDWAKREVSNPSFIMRPVALSDQDGILTLWLPANPDHVSASCKPSSGHSNIKLEASAKTLSTLMEDLGHKRVDVLKMDIEGAEYPVIRDLIDSGAITRVGVLLVEFHHWMPAFTLADTRTALARLESVGFVPAWVSPSGHEVLFVNRRTDTEGASSHD